MSFVFAHPHYVLVSSPSPLPLLIPPNIHICTCTCIYVLPFSAESSWRRCLSTWDLQSYNDRARPVHPPAFNGTTAPSPVEPLFIKEPVWTCWYYWRIHWLWKERERGGEREKRKNINLLV